MWEVDNDEKELVGNLDAPNKDTNTVGVHTARAEMVEAQGEDQRKVVRGTKLVKTFWASRRHHLF